MHGDFSRLEVADLAYEYNIRVLAQNSPKPVRKIVPFFRIDLRLRYGRKAVFNWIFNSYYFNSGLVHSFYKRVKGSCFSRSSWPRCKYHPVGLIELFLYNRVELRVHP